MLGVQERIHGDLVPVRQRQVRVLVQQRGVRVLDLDERVEELLVGEDLVGAVAGDGDGGEVGREGDLGGLGVDLQVDVGHVVGLEQGAARRGAQQHRVDVAAHDDEAPGQGCELRVHPHRQRDVGEGPAAVDEDLARVRPDLLHHPGGGALARQLALGEALEEGGLAEMAGVSRGRLPAQLLCRFVLRGKSTLLKIVLVFEYDYLFIRFGSRVVVRILAVGQRTQGSLP